MVHIIPAILATTEEEYKDKLQKLEQTPELEGSWVQIDLMDGKFVPNKSISPDVLKKYSFPFRMEAHLMVEDVLSLINPLVATGAKRIIFPIETNNAEESINAIRNHGIEIGLALNPETDVAKLEPFVSKIDVVLVMSVHPGFGGQAFIPESINKIKEVSHLRSKNNTSFEIEVDGGVSEENAKELVAAGADGPVIGSHLLEGDISENVEKIWQVIST